MAYDLQIDFYIGAKTASFDGDVIVDVINDEVTIVALSGTFDYIYTGEFIDYLTGGGLFDLLVKHAMSNPMFLARVAEEIREEEQAAA